MSIAYTCDRCGSRVAALEVVTLKSKQAGKARPEVHLCAEHAAEVDAYLAPDRSKPLPAGVKGRTARPPKARPDRPDPPPPTA